MRRTAIGHAAYEKWACHVRRWYSKRTPLDSCRALYRETRSRPPTICGLPHSPRRPPMRRPTKPPPLHRRMKWSLRPSRDTQPHRSSRRRLHRGRHQSRGSAPAPLVRRREAPLHPLAQSTSIGQLRTHLAVSPRWLRAMSSRGRGWRAWWSGGSVAVRRQRRQHGDQHGLAGQLGSGSRLPPSWRDRSRDPGRPPQRMGSSETGGGTATARGDFERLLVIGRSKQCSQSTPSRERR
jgi:hypothetical protein